MKKNQTGQDNTEKPCGNLRFPRFLHLFRRGMLDNTGAFRYNTGIVNILIFTPFFRKKELLGMVATEISEAVFFQKNSTVLKGK